MKRVSGVLKCGPVLDLLETESNKTDFDKSNKSCRNRRESEENSEDLAEKITAQKLLAQHFS